MKPIIFNTEDVRTILDGRKSVTRRVMKPQPDFTPMKTFGGSYRISDKAVVNEPYHPGSIIYVRETWARIGEDVESIWFENPGQLHNGQIIYRADFEEEISECRWRPSIHMPKEAARIFLRVKRVWTERLQEITEEQAEAEGCIALIRSARYNFASLWDSTVKKADLPRYGWDASPWVWAIAFERISKEEASSELGKELERDERMD